MGSNKRDLKAYVRYDGSGRVVAGSLVLRRQKPKVGKWKEIQGYRCCNLPVITSTSMATFPANTATGIVIYCDTSNAYIDMVIMGDFATIEDLVSALNHQASAMGTFSVATDGVNINVNPAATLANMFAGCNNSLIFEVYNY